MNRSATFVASVLLAAALVVVIVPSSSAQAPTVTGGVYFTNNVKTPAGTGGTGTKTFVATDIAPTAAAPSKAYMPSSPGPLTYTAAFDYPVTTTLTLSGDLTVKAWVSCDKAAAFRPGNSNPANPVASSRAVLAKGTTAISQTSRYDTMAPCTGPTSVNELDFTVPSMDATFSAGDVLEVQILVWWTNTDDSVQANGHLLVGSAAYPSGITGAGLPTGGATVTPAGPVVLYSPINGTVASIHHAFASPTNTTYVFNWTAPAGTVAVHLAATVTSGTANLTIRGAANTTLLQRTFPGGAVGNLTLAGGAWQVRIVYTGFAGNLTLDASAAPVPTTGTTTTTTTAGTTTSTSSKASPGLELLLNSIAFFGAVLLVRRRLP